MQNIQNIVSSASVPTSVAAGLLPRPGMPPRPGLLPTPDGGPGRPGIPPNLGPSTPTSQGLPNFRPPIMRPPVSLQSPSHPMAGGPRLGFNRMDCPRSEGPGNTPDRSNNEQDKDKDTSNLLSTINSLFGRPAGDPQGGAQPNPRMPMLGSTPPRMAMGHNGPILSVNGPRSIASPGVRIAAPVITMVGGPGTIAGGPGGPPASLLAGNPGPGTGRSARRTRASTACRARGTTRTTRRYDDPWSQWSHDGS